MPDSDDSGFEPFLLESWKLVQTPNTRVFMPFDVDYCCIPTTFRSVATSIWPKK
jgi:hypothetical protein